MTISFSFLGTILPSSPALTIEATPTVESDVVDGNPATMTVAVRDGCFEVTIELATFDEPSWQALFGPATDFARMHVEAVGFVTATPYNAFIDTIVRPDGTQKALALGDPGLAAQVGFGIEDSERIAELAMSDFPLSLALSDLMMMLSKTHYSPIAAGRVADSLARLIAPGESPKTAWPKLHAALRADEAYIKFLTEHSKASRHGDRQYLPGEITQELARRAWTLMGRYLRLRLDGPLDSALYPMLHGA